MSRTLEDIRRGGYAYSIVLPNLTNLVKKPLINFEDDVHPFPICALGYKPNLPTTVLRGLRSRIASLQLLPVASMESGAKLRFTQGEW